LGVFSGCCGWGGGAGRAGGGRADSASATTTDGTMDFGLNF